MKEDDDSSGAMILAAIIGTAFWLFLCAMYLFFSGSAKSFWSLDPNEFGDLFAGLTAPLAFGWLALAVFLQRNELKLQRKELKAQREEFRDMRELQLPIRQKQDIDEHFDDLLRMMTQLGATLREATTDCFEDNQNNPNPEIALFDNILPAEPQRLKSLTSYQEIILGLQSRAKRLATNESESVWFAILLTQLQGIQISLSRLDERLQNSHEARDFFWSYKDMVRACEEETGKLLSLLLDNSTKI